MHRVQARYATIEQSQGCISLASLKKVFVQSKKVKVLPATCVVSTVEKDLISVDKDSRQCV